MLKRKYIITSLIAASSLLVGGCSDLFFDHSAFKCTSIDQVEVVYDIKNNYSTIFAEVKAGVGIVMIETKDQSFITNTATIIKKNGQDYYFVTSLINPDEVASYEIVLGDHSHFFNDEITYVGSYNPFRMSILKVTTSNSLYAPTWGSSSSIKVGQDILALGTPDASNLFNTMTKGVISSQLDIYYPQYNPPYSVDPTMNIVGFQIDAPTNYGQRGGAVFNLNKELIGIISERYYLTSTSSSTITIDSMTFVLGTDEISLPFNSIIESGSYTKPKIGVSVKDLSGLSEAYKKEANQNLETLGLPSPLPLDIYTGLFIVTVVEGGAGALANLPAGHVITSVDGVVVDRMAKLDSYLLHHKPGDTITMTLLNPENKQTTNYQVTLK